MKFGFFILSQSPEGRLMKDIYDESLEQAEWAEKLGYDTVFLGEHAFVHHGKPSPHVILGNIAARTKRVRIGTTVCVLPWHHPLHVAQDYATVDLLSDGRLNFGVGRGTFKSEFDGYGVPWEEAQERFEESLKIILKAWTGEPFSYEGKFFQIPEVVVIPKPLQKPHPPLWQPCTSPASIERALRFGATPILNANLFPSSDVKKAFDRLDILVKQTGRTDLDRASVPYLYVSDTNQKAYGEAREALQWHFEDFAKMATLPEGQKWPEQYKFYESWAQFFRSMDYNKIVEEGQVWFGDAKLVSQRIRWLRDECGVTYVVLFTAFGGMEHEKVMKSMELFAKKVMPEFM